MKNYFVRNIPISHFVHQSFAKSISAKTILPGPIKLKYVLIPGYNILRIPLTLSKYDPQGNYFCEGFAGLYFASILKVFKPKIRIIYHDADAIFYRNYPKFKSLKKKYIDFFINKIDYAISDSNISKKYLTKYIKLKKDVPIVYPFIKTKDINFKPNLGSNNIIYIGRFAEEKNLFRLIDAFKEVSKKTNSKLYLVGDGPLKKQLKHKIKELNIEDKVIFTGWVKNINPYLKKCIIGYNVSNFEPFGCSGLEFALSGVIPLLGNRNGNAEVLNNKKIICNPDNTKHITKTMLNLINLEERDQLTLLKNLKIQAKKFNQENQCKKFKTEFNKLIK